MSDVSATSFATPNFSGMLFNRGNTKCPLSSMIGGRSKTTNHVEFVLGQEYATDGGSQPEISEIASLTAPNASIKTRSQSTNVTQIFQESVAISDAKKSNMGTLSGVNIAGQQANPVNELDFQTGCVMQKIARDIEYTFVNGVYNKATTDSEVNKTRGLVNAITTNTMDIGGKALGLWDVAEMMKTMYDNNSPIDGLILLCNANTLYQLNADAQQNGFIAPPMSREINGIELKELVTPMGISIPVRLGEFMPTGTALMLTIGAISPVYQPVPGKGNFYREELGKAGAGEKYHIFGQVGLDYGMEWMHAKITGISSGFTAPKYSKSVYVSGGSVATIETDATLTAANLNKSTVAADDTAKVGIASLEYNVVPATAPSLTYLWQIRAKTGTTWTDLTSSYTGYNTSELTVKAADAEKHYRCKVTASGSATGTVYSDECTVNAS